MGIFKPNIEKMKENRDIDGLIKALKHADGKVRRYAAIALGMLADKHAVEPLTMLLKDPNRDVQVEAAIALGMLGDKHAVELLIDMLKDSDGRMRRRAAIVLGKIGDKHAVEHLIEVLKDPDPWLRGCVARALGGIGDPKALGALEMLKDDRKEAWDWKTKKWNSVSEIADEAIDKIKSGDAYKVYLREQEEEKKRQLELERERERKRKQQEEEKKKRQLELERERKREQKQQDIVNTIDELLGKEANLFVEDIKNSLSKGDIDDAEKLLEERKIDYEQYLELVRNVKDVEEEVTMLSRRLAKGELTSDAYERARDDLDKRKYDIDEKLWKIQRKIFREKYEKPF